MYLFTSVFFDSSHAANNWKPLNHEINHEKQTEPTKNFGPTKYTWEIILDHEVPKRKKLGPTKYHEI